MATLDPVIPTAVSAPARNAAPARPRRRQRGAMSVEFVLLFPALFLILYAIVSYGLIFGAQHTLALAAAEGGRAALRYQRADDADQALALRAEAARQAALRPLAWLGGLGVEAVAVPPIAPAPCPGEAALTCLTVRVEYDYGAAPLVPPLLLPVPARLSSEAVVQLSPMQLL